MHIIMKHIKLTETSVHVHGMSELRTQATRATQLYINVEH